MLHPATEVVKQEANHPGGFADGLLPLKKIGGNSVYTPIGVHATYGVV
jgi:hypothetical protein